MKQRIKFNVYDILIILFILLCITGIIFRSSIAGAVSSAVYDDEVRIHFTVSQADDSIISSINAGDIFYLENGAKFGMLMEGYTYSNALTHTFDKNGKLSTDQSNDLYEISGVFSVTGRVTENGFICSTEKLYINSELTVHSKLASFTLTVTEIENISAPDTVQ